MDLTSLDHLATAERDREIISLEYDRHYSAGEIISHGLPFAQVTLGIYKGKRCDFCLKIPNIGQKRLQRCSKCRRFYYCNSECQSLDWKAGHRYKECLLYQIDRRQVLKDNECSRLMARIYLMLLAQPKFRFKKFTVINDRQASFSNLEAHYKDILSDPDRMKDFAQFYIILHKLIDHSNSEPAVELKHYLEQKSPGLNLQSTRVEGATSRLYWDKELMFEYFCKICINAYTMSSQELKNLATAIYIHGAVVDHSCYPTAMTTFIQNRLVLKAACDILPGEKVTIPYCDLKESAEDRNNLLRERYYFTCCCTRCTNYKKLEEKLDYSKLKNIGIQLNKCIKNKNYKEALDYGLKSLDMYCRIYRQSYHPDLTLQLMKIGKIRLNLGDKIEYSDYEGCCTLAFFKEKILTHMRVTHGLNSPLYQEYLDDFESVQQNS